MPDNTEETNNENTNNENTEEQITTVIMAAYKDVDGNWHYLDKDLNEITDPKQIANFLKLNNATQPESLPDSALTVQPTDTNAEKALPAVMSSLLNLRNAINKDINFIQNVLAEYHHAHHMIDEGRMKGLLDVQKQLETLIVQYHPKTITVKYSCHPEMGGTWANESKTPQDKKYAPGEIIPLPTMSSTDVTCEGKAFIGWYSTDSKVPLLANVMSAGSETEIPNPYDPAKKFTLVEPADKFQIPFESKDGAEYTIYAAFVDLPEPPEEVEGDNGEAGSGSASGGGSESGGGDDTSKTGK